MQALDAKCADSSSLVAEAAATERKPTRPPRLRLDACTSRFLQAASNLAPNTRLAARLWPQVGSRPPQMLVGAAIKSYRGVRRPCSLLVGSQAACASFLAPTDTLMNEGYRRQAGRTAGESCCRLATGQGLSIHPPPLTSPIDRSTHKPGESRQPGTGDHGWAAAGGNGPPLLLARRAAGPRGEGGGFLPGRACCWRVAACGWRS